MQNRWWPSGILSAGRLQLPELSACADRRLQALEMWRRTGHLRDVCEVFRVSRPTLYRWRERYHPHDLGQLEPRSRRPRRVRQPQWSAGMLRAVRGLRQQYPRWGKHKLVVLLQRRGFQISESTVGRILRHLRRRGELVEPARRRRVVSRQRPRPWAQRCPGGPPKPQAPGDLVQLDTLQIRPLPNVTVWQFTARDVVSRWDVLEVHHRATSTAAARFLATLQRRLPFPVRALQVDGGSEFKACFEAACQKLKLPLYALPPRSPKLNGHVERANGTHRQEFYEVTPDCPWTVMELNRRLRRWEHIYNHVRPHQALEDLTPAQFLAAYAKRGPQSHMSWTRTES